MAWSARACERLPADVQGLPARLGSNRRRLPKAARRKRGPGREPAAEVRHWPTGTGPAPRARGRVPVSPASKSAWPPVPRSLEKRPAGTRCCDPAGLLTFGRATSGYNRAEALLNLRSLRPSCQSIRSGSIKVRACGAGAQTIIDRKMMTTAVRPVVPADGAGRWLAACLPWRSSLRLSLMNPLSLPPWGAAAGACRAGAQSGSTPRARRR